MVSVTDRLFWDFWRGCRGRRGRGRRPLLVLLLTGDWELVGRNTNTLHLFQLLRVRVVDAETTETLLALKDVLIKTVTLAVGFNPCLLTLSVLFDIQWNCDCLSTEPALLGNTRAEPVSV